MIQTIEVLIHNGIEQSLNALIVYPKNICYINNKKYNVSDYFMEEVIQAICLWRPEYGNDTNIDSEEFLVTVKSTDGKETFHGKGFFPHNYETLKELLGDIND